MLILTLLRILVRGRYTHRRRAVCAVPGCTRRRVPHDPVERLRPAVWRPSAGWLILAATIVVSGLWGTVAYAQEEPLVSVTAETPEVAEGDDVVFRLSRSGPVSDRLVVGLYVGGHEKMMSIETDAIASAGGGAAVDTTVAFEEGESEVLVRLTTDDDNVAEGDGLVTVRIARFDTSPYRLGDSRAAEVLVRDDDVPTVSIRMPELPAGMALSESGDAWEGSVVEGEAISFTIVCAGDYEYLPSPNVMRTYFTWIQEMNHPGFFTQSTIDRGIIGNNGTGYSQMFNCEDRTVPDPVGASRRFVGPDGGEVRIGIVASNVGFSQTLRDLKDEYQAAEEEAKRLGVPLTAPGLFGTVNDTFTFHCDDELRFCPSYHIGSPHSIRVRVLNRDPVILIKAEGDHVSEGQPARFVLERLWNEENLADSTPGWADTVVLVEATVTGGQSTGPLPTEVTFGRNETLKVIEVVTVNDQTYSEDGSATIAILADTTGPDQNPAAKYSTAQNWLGHTEPGKRSDRATVTITDDDEQVLSVEFGGGSYTVTEGRSVEMVVMLNADPGRDVTIPLSVENQGGVSNTDYNVADSVTFVSGQTEKTLVFAATHDTIDDDGESVVVGFGTLPDGVVVGAVGTSTVTITDDDVQEVIASPRTLEVAEGQSVTYMVVLATEPAEDLTISVNDPTNPDITTDPQTLTFTVDNWDQAQMVTVHAGHDDDPEDETGEVTHSVNGDAHDSMDPPTVMVTVRDDDPNCEGATIWCATVEFADQSIPDRGLYQLFYHRSSEPPSSLTDPEFVYEGRVHTITNIYLSPGIPPDSDSPPTGIQTKLSTFFISILPGRLGQVPDTGVPETDYLNWTLHIGGVELPFKESEGPTKSDGRRGMFVWEGQAIQGLFTEWPLPTTYQLRIEA